MPQASAGGFVLILALLNGWLAARCGRSSLGWFLASLLLAPLAWVMTLFLVTRPRVAPDSSSAPRGVITIAALLLAVLVGGWVVLLAAAPSAGTTASPSSGLGQEVVPSQAMSLNVSNGTTLTVTLVVNRTVVATAVPGMAVDPIPASALPALPWVVEARSPSGRVLTSMTVKAGDVWRSVLPDGSVEDQSDGARVDLSCGRLDIWSGTPMIGPAPGPGSPGDCAP